MKKLTPAEKAKFITRPMERQGYARILLMNMQVGDIILMELKDWNSKSAPPSYLIRRIEAKTKREYTCEKVISPGTGWIITRNK